MIGEGYWTTGVVIEERGAGRWKVELAFYDDGFAESWSTEGVLRVRYLERDVEEAVRVLIADAKRLGITFRDDASVFYKGDGEKRGADFPERRRRANEIALAVGLEQAYGRERITSKAGASQPEREKAQ